MKQNDPCVECGRYNNRGISIDAVIIRNHDILLIKRGIEPFKNRWALPGGYIDWDESVEDSVKREVKEETGLIVGKLRLIGVYSSPERHPKQVIDIAYLILEAKGSVVVGDDASDSEWFAMGLLPKQLAFDHSTIIKDAMQLVSK